MKEIKFNKCILGLGPLVYLGYPPPQCSEIAPSGAS